MIFMVTDAIPGQPDLAVASTMIDLLYNYAYWMTRNPDEARTLVMQSYSHMLRQLRFGEVRHNIRVRLFQIVRILTHDRVAYDNQNKQTPPSLSFHGDRKGVEIASHQSAVYLERIVADLVSSLAERYSTVLILSDILDLTYGQIAELVQCSVQEVGSRLHEARKEFCAGLLQYAEMNGVIGIGAQSPYDQLMKLYTYSTLEV
jgi:DNA-directed RNA polymerase specialized sigma24 family protein